MWKWIVGIVAALIVGLLLGAAIGSHRSARKYKESHRSEYGYKCGNRGNENGCACSNRGMGKEENNSINGDMREGNRSIILNMHCMCGGYAPERNFGPEPGRRLPMDEMMQRREMDRRFEQEPGREIKNYKAIGKKEKMENRRRND